MREGVRYEDVECRPSEPSCIRGQRSVLMMLVQEDALRSLESGVWPGGLAPDLAGEEDGPDWSCAERNLRGRVSLHPHPASGEAGGAGPGPGVAGGPGLGPGQGGGVLWRDLDCSPGDN